MANVHDYLLWRGDLSFEERPFNDVDNLILATLSYLDFTGIVPGEKRGGAVLLSRACQQLLEVAGDDFKKYVRSLAQVDSSFVKLLASSRRFGSATLRGYVDIVDPTRSLQFSALQIDLPNQQTYVAFRGTDSTLVGWREDFMLSYAVTEAQRQACHYLDRALECAAAANRTVLVGGHSKGGVLAEYAAATCNELLRSRIARVYSNDGPGMAPEVMRVSSDEVLGDRLVRIVPAYSVVGMLFAQPGQRRIIAESAGIGIGQHDPTTWQVMPAGMQEASKLQQDCQVLNESIASWAAELSLEERERVTNEVFDALEAGGARTFAEIADTPEGLRTVRQALEACDERTREVGLALIERVVNNSMGAATRAAQETVRQLRKAGQEMAEGAMKLLQKRIDERRAPQDVSECNALPEEISSTTPVQALPQAREVLLLQGGQDDAQETPEGDA